MTRMHLTVTDVVWRCLIGFSEKKTSGLPNLTKLLQHAQILQVVVATKDTNMSNLHSTGSFGGSLSHSVKSNRLQESPTIFTCNHL